MPDYQKAPEFEYAERIKGNGMQDYYRIALGTDAEAYLRAIGLYTEVTVENDTGTIRYTYSTALDK